MTALSLSAHDRQAIEAIEGQLAASDPRLAAMMATFSRLEDGEAVPAREQIQAARRQRQAKRHRLASQRQAGRTRPVLSRNLRTLHIALVLWVVMTIALAIAFVAVGSHGGSRPPARSHGCRVIAAFDTCGT